MIFDNFRRSFSTRLSFFILLFTTTIFVVAFSFLYLFSSQTIEQNARTKSENTLQIINLQIEKVLRRVEAVPNNLNWIISNGSIHSDSMYSIARNVVHNNPDIYGSAIAFEPYYFKEKGYYFSPYSYRDGDSICSLQLGNEDYDYFSWEWYEAPKKLGRPCWSEPYYDKGGGQMVMCTYAAPIFDKNNTLMGVFTSDISMEWLTNMIDNMRYQDKSDIFMLGKDGTYIIHKQRESILNQTIFDVAEETCDLQLKLLGDSMIASKQGMQVLNQNGKELFVFYAPVPQTRWSLGIILPKEEIFGDLRRTNLKLFLIVGFGLIALLLICSRTIKNLTRPLKKFAISARAIAHGNFEVQLPDIQSEDEMKELLDSFSYMQSELTNYIANLKRTTSAKEKIESELKIAHDIQMGMIPKVFPPFPKHEELDIYAVLKPAKEVGGDLYDFFMEEDHLYFAIGDVSGKGVPASLLMAVTLSLFRSVAVRMESPAAIMNSLNNSISEKNDSNMFVTLLIGILNLKNGSLKYCNAGHNPPMLVAQNNECNALKVVPNISLGIIKDFPYQEQMLTLPNSSVLVLYTDGVTEAENVEKNLYGNQKLLDAICKSPKSSTKKIIETILADIKLHVGVNVPSDDITLLAIEYAMKSEIKKQTLTISNNIEDLKNLSEFIEQIGEPMNLPPKLLMNLNLALEEAVSNVIFYACKDHTDNKLIEINVLRKSNKLVITITDDGIEFDPTRIGDPDITLSTEERNVGGLGIFLIKQLINEVEYRREDEKNILTLTQELLT
jgi:sigma-B regulation protein RsbU (phosphoserine phosphatase)